MVDPEKLVRAVLAARDSRRTPNALEVSMVHVALSQDPSPATLSELLGVLDDSSRFDTSIDFALIGQILQTVEKDGDQALPAFVSRWAP